MPDVIDPTDRASFVAWGQDIARFGDTDRLGHINNAAYSTFLETARVQLFNDPADPAAPAGHTFVIVKLLLEFRAEMQWHGVVEIGTVLRSIGRSSFTLAHGVFKDGVCCATAELVMVLFDETTRRSAPLTGALRTRLEALALKA